MPDYKFKVANMKKEQSFTLYPYTGGNTILLQSDKRFARVDLRKGEGFINSKNKEYANSIALALSPISFTLPEDIKIQIQSFLWNNDGKDGTTVCGCLHWENKQLFQNQ